MKMDWLILAAGFLVLVVGAECLVRAALALALKAKVSPLVAGLTIVAAGTSLPEFVVTLQASLAGNGGIAAGNIVGSNVFNIGAILGFCALIRPLRIQTSTLRQEWPLMAGITLLFVLAGANGVVSRLEAFCLVSGLILSTWRIVFLAKRADAATMSSHQSKDAPKTGPMMLLRTGGLLLVGIVCLAAGATWMVNAAVSIARDLGVSETVVGLTIVAAGTSLPELVTSLVASMKGRDDMAVANVIGSNLFNAGGIGGLSGLIEPLQVPAEIVTRDNGVMLVLSCLLWPFMKSGQRIGRLEGGVLLALYVSYLGFMLRST